MLLCYLFRFQKYFEPLLIKLLMYYLASISFFIWLYLIINKFQSLEIKLSNLH